MVLADTGLKLWIAGGGIAPGDFELVNPSSVDLKTGNTYRRPRWYWRFALTRWIVWQIFSIFMPHKLPHNSQNTNVYWGEAVVFETLTIFPGELVLLHSTENIAIPPDKMGLLFSKSSTGRKGLEHLHAGLFDPSFRGVATFEVVNTAPWPITIRCNERLMQLTLVSTETTPEKGYNGRYVGQTGPTPARSEKIEN